MQETAHNDLKKKKKGKGGDSQFVRIHTVSSPPLSYPKLHLTGGSLNGPIVILTDNPTAEYNEAGIN